MTDQKQTYRFKYSDHIVAERQYQWIDRVLILRTSDRQVLMGRKFSDLALGNWELTTPQEDKDVPKM